jgi:DNA-binding response OmpR family regulator
VKQVLIVEDDAAIRDALLDALGDSGYAVSSAATGREALEQMRTSLPDIVLLDLMLPDMDGWTFLRARERERNLLAVPVLVISAVGPKGLQQAQDLGAPIYLSKPFDLDQLLAEVERLCSGVVRQCAWCGQVMDNDGDFGLHSGRKLRWASHGICPRCKEVEREDLLN